MKKTLLLTAVLGCSALWAGAQQSSTMPNAQSGATAPGASSAQTQSGAAQATSPSAEGAAGQTAGQAAPSAAAGNSVTVEGCLANSGSDYMLKDKTSGVTYKLAGDVAKLTPYVGKELQLTGTTSNAGGGAATATSTAGGSSMPTLNMMSGKASSTACSAQ